MPKVISDTTPILSLLKINKLYLLKELYGQIIVPYAVFREIENGKQKPCYQNLKHTEWIKFEYLKNPTSLDLFIDLDAGEAEVLILAKEINADLVILDEILGRRYAKQLGLNMTGTIGILLKSKEIGLIKSISGLLTELSEKGTWFNQKLIKMVLKLSNES